MGRRAQGLSQILLPWVPQSLQLVPGAVVCSGGGAGPGSRASSPRGRPLLSGQGAGGTASGHCSSSEDSWEMPSSSSFSSFLGLPLGFLPGVVVTFRVLAVPLFLLPLGRPRGLFGVGTSLGSFCKDIWESAETSNNQGCRRCSGHTPIKPLKTLDQRKINQRSLWESREPVRCPDQVYHVSDLLQNAQSCSLSHL